MENDFDVSVFIVTETNNIVIPEEYDRYGDDKGVFVMVTNDKLNPEYGDDDNTMYIHKDHLYNDSEIWQERHIITSALIPDIDTVYYSGGLLYSTNPKEKDNRNRLAITWNLNGYKQTKDIMLNVDRIMDVTKQSKKEIIPAIMSVYDTVIEFDNREIHGYLPTIGQLVYMSKNIVSVSDTVSKLTWNIYMYRIEGKKQYLRQRYWSSTQYNSENSWILNDDDSNISSKGLKHIIIPMFKIKNFYSD